MTPVLSPRHPVTADDVDRGEQRLFPELPDGFEPWDAFLGATGRGELPGFPCRESRRWFGEPVA